MKPIAAYCRDVARLDKCPDDETDQTFKAYRACIPQAEPIHHELHTMSFQFSERHIEEYLILGYTVFRGVLPPNLISDLRRVTEVGREQARQRHGDQVHRMQPVNDYDLDLRPFENYRDLPALREAIDRLLGPQFVYGDFRWLGVMLEPAVHPYCMAWHRDANELLTADEWEHYTKHPEYGHQVNAPLYEDSCTWFVPASHNRINLPRETKFAASDGRWSAAPDLEGKTYEERERICYEYCLSMPGARQLHLNAGDFAIYKPWAWHLGNYLPYRKRATLLDGVFTEKSLDWIDFIKMKHAKH